MSPTYGEIKFVEAEDGKYAVCIFEHNHINETKQIKLRDDESNKDTAIAVLRAWRAEMIAATMSKRGARNRGEVLEMLKGVKDRVAERNRIKAEKTVEHALRASGDVSMAVSRYKRSAMEESYTNVFGHKA